MKRLYSLLALLLCGFIATMVSADIYVWTDEEGVKHFTNFAPPAEAQILMKTEELPYDEAADTERIEAEKQERLVEAWQQIAEKEAELLERQQQAELRIAAANRKAEEALQEAEALLNEADEIYQNSSNRGYRIYGYYPFIPHFKYPYWTNPPGLKRRHIPHLPKGSDYRKPGGTGYPYKSQAISSENQSRINRFNRTGGYRPGGYVPPYARFK